MILEHVLLLILGQVSAIPGGMNLSRGHCRGVDGRQSLLLVFLLDLSGELVKVGLLLELVVPTHGVGLVYRVDVVAEPF